MLEIKGELVFKTVAYHRAADVIERSPIDLVAAYRAGQAAAAAGRRSGHQRQDRRARARPATWPTTTSSPPRSRPASSRSSGSRASGPRRSASSTTSWASRRSTISRRPPSDGRLRTIRGLSGKTEAQILEGIARIGTSSLADAPGPGRRARRRPAAPRCEARPGLLGLTPAGSFRRRRESIGDLDLLAETADGAAVIERFVDQPATEEVIGRGSYKAAIRLRGGPQVDLMVVPPGEGGHVRHPLHGLEGAQRPPARDGPRPGLEPVREGLPAHRRGRRAAHRRRGRAADVRDRGGGVRLRRPAVHRAGAARGGRRVRGGPGRDACRRSSRSATCAATSTATRNGPTARSRSRSWPRPPAGAATPTRS